MFCEFLNLIIFFIFQIIFISNETLQACDGTGATVCDNSESQCPPFGTIMVHNFLA